MIATRALGRRAVLRSAGGIAISLPWLEAMSGAARAQAVFPKRLVVFFSACGTHPKDWFPTGGETDFQLSRFLAPLAPHRQDLVILKGVNFLSAMPDQPGDGHQRGMGNFLTATGNTPAKIGGGISIDQQIATRLAAPTKFRSLELGVQVRYNGDTIYERISYLGPAQPTPAEDDPVAAFKRIFGGFSAPACNSFQIAASAALTVWEFSRRSRPTVRKRNASTSRLSGLTSERAIPSQLAPISPSSRTLKSATISSGVS